MKKLIFFILSLALLSACKQKIDEFKAAPGSANLSKYVAVGNSLMAGYADGALYNSGQLNSIPNILALQFQAAGGGTFVQPMVESEFGIDLFGMLPPKLVLGYKDLCGNTTLAPVRSSGALDPFAPVGYVVDNFGVPGAKSFHLLAPHYGDPAGLLTNPPSSNPYFVRFASSAATTVLADIMARNPTFFTMWLGDNDVLSYALYGGALDTITSPAFFQMVMGGILQTMTAQGAKGAITNIPDITSIPYFTTIPYNSLYLSRQTLVDSINGFMANLFHLPFVYHVGYNPFLMVDASAQNFFKVRQMKPGEMVLLSVPQDSMKCYGMGIISALTYVPWGIPNQFVLDSTEVANIQNATFAYNQIITGLAGTFGLALVDMNAKMASLQKGILWDGINLDAEFVSGGAFSLDGIHLNPRGNAVAANYFIEAINAKYGSTISLVDITKYHGVIFP